MITRATAKNTLKADVTRTAAERPLGQRQRDRSAVSSSRRRCDLRRQFTDGAASGAASGEDGDAGSDEGSPPSVRGRSEAADDVATNREVRVVAASGVRAGGSSADWPICETITTSLQTYRTSFPR